MKERITKEYLGIIVTAGTLAFYGLSIAGYGILNKSLDREVRERYPNFAKVCGAAANRAGLSCDWEITQENLSLEEQKQILNEAKTYRQTLLREKFSFLNIFERR